MLRTSLCAALAVLLLAAPASSAIMWAGTYTGEPSAGSTYAGGDLKMQASTWGGSLWIEPTWGHLNYAALWPGDMYHYNTGDGYYYCEDRPGVRLFVYYDGLEPGIYEETLTHPPSGWSPTGSIGVR